MKSMDMVSRADFAPGILAVISIGFVPSQATYEWGRGLATGDGSNRNGGYPDSHQ